MNKGQDTWTVLSMLKWGTGYFQKRNVPSPRHSIEWLLAEVLKVKRLDLYLEYERPLSSDELDRLRPLVKRRARHEPLQYISVQCDFMKIELTVNPDVLIPRIETEQLTEIILGDYPDKRGFSALDIGTGSGCIAIALKHERPSWNIYATDISEKALQIARQNAARCDADISFVRDDFTQKTEPPISSIPFELIISNPPYILPKEKPALEPQVKNYEPAEALFCRDIEAMYRQLIYRASALLKAEGMLYLEINDAYAEDILSIFDTARWNCKLLKDYNNKPRFIKARLQK